MPSLYKFEAQHMRQVVQAEYEKRTDLIKVDFAGPVPSEERSQSIQTFLTTKNKSKLTVLPISIKKISQ